MNKNLIFAFFVLLLATISCHNSVSNATFETGEIDKMAQFKIDQLQKASDPENLVLKEDNIADLYFDGNSGELNESSITEFFKNFNIEVQKNEGFDESGPIVYFSAWKGQSVFHLTPNKDNKSVKTFYVQISTVVDQYGVEKNMDYEHLVYLRPNLRLDFTIDGVPLLRAKDSNIMYRMCCPSERKNDYSIEEMKEWKVEAIARQPFFEMEHIQD